MPPVQAVTIAPDALTLCEVRDQSGTIRLSRALVPGTLVLAADIEAWINTWWTTACLTCQVVCHVEVLSPLRVGVFVANLGATIPANWWAR